MCHRNFPNSEFNKMKKKLQIKLRYGDLFNINNDQAIEKKSTIIFNYEKLTDDEEEFNFFKKSKHEKVKKIDIDKFFTKKILWMFSKLLIVYCQIKIIYGLSLIINKNLGLKNLFLNGFLVAFCETIGYTIGAIISVKFGRRQINNASAFLITIFSLIILGMDLVSNRFTSYNLSLIHI